MSHVKIISCLRSRDKKAPKFSHLINITGYPFNTSPHKNISRLRSNKFHDETIFLPVKCIFCFKILRNFPSFHLFCVQNAAFKWCRVKVTYAMFHTAEWCNLTAVAEVSYFFHDAETAVGHSPLLGFLSQQPKNCIGWPEADPSCFMACMSLRLAKFCRFNSLGLGGN
jgi:hypothetical protein